MQIIDGKKLAADVLSRLKPRPKPKGFLGAVLLGDDPASLSFLEQKEKAAGELGVDFRLYRLKADLPNDEARAEIGRLARQKPCCGMIVQLPLPERLNKHYILNAIPEEKDVDVLSERALGAFYAGRSAVTPPAVGTVGEILKSVGWDTAKLKVAVVGPGLLIGRPIANWLMGKSPEVYVLSRGSDLSVLKSVELVVSGVGKAGLVAPDMLKDGAGVIDFGYSRKTEAETKLAGDFDSSLISQNPSLSFYTPTPGGTGPVLVAKLLENFYGLNSVH